MIEAAQELYGKGSKEAIAVQRAYAAINVGADVDEAYKWYRNGAVISGATSATYSLTAQSADNGAVFSAVVTDSSPRRSRPRPPATPRSPSAPAAAAPSA
jgi:hypothetical protein